jgi:hypothetical protein
MHPMFLEQLATDRRHDLEHTAAQVRMRRTGPFRAGRAKPLTRWRTVLRRAPAADPTSGPEPAAAAPAGVGLAALGITRLRHLTVAAERVTQTARATDTDAAGETPNAAA